ncbi:MAG: lipoyl(octanoyl) transferase LipB [Prevotellaceae bacterium]|jgi:lipoyl(octanoyl) transferase|nr:lipoyl(octanoyl) transferase LipB [Prevotellaceae bacterium]
MKFTDWGLIAYKEAWDKQHAIVERMTAPKALPGEDEQQVIFCEHPHVYTLGRHGQADNLLVSEDVLTRIGADFYHTNRGGDVTYHGPGQVVCYPLVDLKRQQCTVKNYIFTLEEIVIRTLRHYRIEAGRIAGAAGVWLDAGTPAMRKICAIGVHVSHGVTMHGFALNANTDLSYYRHINPCGFTDKGVTSVQHETGKPADMDALKAHLRRYFEEWLTKK